MPKSNKHTFTISETTAGGATYSGSFTIRRATIGDKAAIAVKKAQLNGGYYHSPENPGVGIPQEVDTMNGVYAHLLVCIEEGPKWWDEDFAEEEVLFAIFREVMNHERTFLGLPPVPRRESEDGSSEDSPETDEHGGAREVVEGEVPPSLF